MVRRKGERGFRRMPTQKVDPFAPQGEVLGQIMTRRVDVSKPEDLRRRDGMSRTHSQSSSMAPAMPGSGTDVTLERQSSFGSGSNYEDARSAYIRGEECAKRHTHATHLL